MSYKEDLYERTKRSDETKDSSGKFKSIFKDGTNASFWKCDAANHLIDVIPYKAGKFDPYTKEGKMTYVLDLWVHYSVGVNEDSYICLSKTYNKPCPICEYQKELRNQEDFDENAVKELNPKRRAIYNILCHDNDKEYEKGIQIWDSAHWNSERYFLELIRNPRHGGIDMSFSDPSKEGKSLSFKREGKDMQNTRYIGHKTLNRDYELTDDVLNKANCLDELIHIPTYEEVHATFWGHELVEKEETTVEEQKESTPTTTGSPRSRRGQAVESPKEELKKPKPPKDHLAKEGEQPKELRKEDVTSEHCPSGHTFGATVATDEKDCDTCSEWEDCSHEEIRRRRAAKEQGTKVEGGKAETGLGSSRKLGRRMT